MVNGHSATHQKHYCIILTRDQEPSAMQSPPSKMPLFLLHYLFPKYSLVSIECDIWSMLLLFSEKTFLLSKATTTLERYEVWALSVTTMELPLTGISRRWTIEQSLSPRTAVIGSSCLTLFLADRVCRAKFKRRRFKQREPGARIKSCERGHPVGEKKMIPCFSKDLHCK